MAAETTHYNVYRVQLSQGKGPDHEGLALVPAQLENQTAGRFYHVIGSVGLGMDYQKRPGFNFGAEKDYKTSAFLFKIKREFLPSWEEICSSTPAPHDRRVLMEKAPDPPAPDCTSWVNQVVDEAKTMSE